MDLCFSTRLVDPFSMSNKRNGVNVPFYKTSGKCYSMIQEVGIAFSLYFGQK